MGDGSHKKKRFSFACFSARQIPVRNLDLAPEVVRDAVVAHVQRRGNVGSQSQGIKLWKLTEAGLAVYLENASMRYVELSVELTELFNVTVSRGVQVDAGGQLSMHSRDVIPPMHGMLVFVAAVMPAGHTYRFSSRFVPRGDVGGQAMHSPPLAEPTDYLHSPFYLDQQPTASFGNAATGGRHGEQQCEQQ